MGILEDMKIAVDNTLIVMLSKLQDFIMEEVYNAGNPKVYERTMEFISMWMGNPATIVGKEVSGYIAPEYGMLTTNMSKNQHIVTGEALVNMIIQGVRDEDAPWYRQPRDFWQPFISWADANVERIFNEEMSKLQRSTKDITLSII